MLFRLFLSVGLVLATLTASVAQQTVFTAHDLFRVERVMDVSISPEGHIAYAIQRYRDLKDGKGPNYRDLYIYDAATQQHRSFLTGDRMFWSVKWRPDGKAVSFLARLDGAKATQVYAINLAGGSYYQVTESASSVESYEWHPKGTSIGYITTPPYKAANAAMKGKGFDAEVFEEEISPKKLMVWDIAKKDAREITNDGSAFAFTWHPDGITVAVQLAPNNLVDDSYMFKRIHTINTESGEVRQLIDNPGKLEGMAWSPDGQQLAFVSAQDVHDPVCGNIYVVARNNTKKFTELKSLTEGFEGSVNELAWKDVRTILYSSYESTKATLREVPVTGGKSKAIVPGGEIVFSSFSVGGGKVAVSADSRNHPSELYTIDLKNGALKRHTTLNPWLKDKKLGKQETVAWKARDGLHVEGVLQYPVDYQAGQRYPMIIMVHGGPEACVTDGWETSYGRWGQMAAGRGYFVFSPNYRSSSGRGTEFAKLGFGDLAAGEFDDILDGIGHLHNQGLIDRDKVGIGGGSYGGYFSAWAATKHSQHFKAACAFVGISNQISKRNTTDIPWEDYYVHWGKWTNEDVALMYDRSPVKYVENNQTPTLILHGKEDPRVHPSQSLEMYRALKMHGNAAVRLIWYPGEGHGNRNNPAQLDYALRTMQWFDFYIKEGNSKDDLPPKDMDYGISF